MLFNSYAFIFGFLPLTLIVYFTFSRWRWVGLATAWLTLASLGFYAYWNIIYLPLLLFSIVVNYNLGRKIEKLKASNQSAKFFLWLGIAFNLILLGYYKYINFLLESFNSLFYYSFALPEMLLPLAISFYTFTQIAYLVDAYREETATYRYNFLTYTLFVSFFPQLIAGPILRHDQLMPQFNKLRIFAFSPRNAALGLTLFTLGLFKKVAIADNLSLWVAPIFNHATDITFLEAWLGALSYTFQLYFDFSGYSDMAIGLGCLFNIQLPINFDSPYKAISIIDFWRRWHITLSQFLRDYLYIPLGGNRFGRLCRYRNLLITMLLGGLWHGAGWTFVVWGGLHGTFLVINHLWRNLSLQLPKLLGWLITFVVVVGSWVLFRAENLSDAIAILKTMIGLKGIILPNAYQGILGGLTSVGIQFEAWEVFTYLPNFGGQKSFFILFILLLFVTLFPNTNQIMQHFSPTWWWAIGMGYVAVYCLLSLNQVSEFLYFQF